MKIHRKHRLGNGATYREVCLLGRVLVRVPKRSDYMNQRQGGYPVSGVPAHWAHGKPVGRNDQGDLVILNCNFFGIDEKDLDQKIVATVKLVHKTTKNGAKYLMVDIFKTPGITPAYKLNFRLSGEFREFPAGAVCAKVLGSNSLVAIVPLPERKLMAACG